MKKIHSLPNMHLSIFKITLHVNMYSGYKQVEHVNSCANEKTKKCEVACKGIEPNSL